MKGAAATGVTATGLAAFSGGAAAQPDISVTDLDPETGNDSIEGVRDSQIDVERGNRNAQFQNIDIEITEIDEEAETVSGTVSGTVLPNANANQNAAKDFDVEFTDAEVTSLGEVGNPTELVRLEIPDLFLNVLGLLVSLDLEVLVEADENGGLLGQLLAGLGGN